MEVKMKILVEKSDVIWDKVIAIMFYIIGILIGIIANDMFLIILSIVCIISRLYQLVKIIKIKSKHQR